MPKIFFINLKKIINLLFYLYLFFIPWQTRYFIKEGYLEGKFWEYGTFSIYAIDLLFFSLLILMLFYKIKNKQSLRFSSPLFSILIVFFLLLVLSVGIADNKEIALYHLFRWFLGILFFWLVNILDFDLKKALGFILTGAFVQSILAFFQFFQQKITANKWLGLASHDPSFSGTVVLETIQGRFLRAYGALPHPNILAGFFIVSMLLGWALYFLVREKRRKLILFANIFITLGLILTFSRSAFGVWFLVLTFMGIFSFKFSSPYQKLLIKIAGFSFIFFLIFGFVFQNLIFTRFTTLTLTEQYSLKYRSIYQNQAFKIISQYYALGVGLNNFTWQVYQKKIKPDIPNFQYQPVHNIYLLILSEISFLGLVVFLYLIFRFLQLWVRSIKKNNIVSLLLGLSFLSLLLIGLVDHYPVSLSSGLNIFWLSLAFFEKGRNIF